MVASTEASRKKLLLNAEKTVGSELNDEETKIADVQKVRQMEILNPSYPVAIESKPVRGKLFWYTTGITSPGW